MGVHITFVRSTNLDSWSWAQLHRMKVGGNGAAHDFFATHGGSALLAPSTEGKIKYTSNTANLYRSELQRKELEDAGGDLNSPFYVPGTEPPAVKSALAKDDFDFFDEWDKPADASATPETPSAAPVPAPVATAAPPAQAPAAEAPAPMRTAQPLAPVTSAELRGGPRRTLGARPVGRGGKLSLGVRKMGAPVNFDDAERRAREEQERQAAAAAETARIAEAQRVADEKAAEAVAAAAAHQKNAAAEAAKAQTQAAKEVKTAQGNAGVDRLGMGFSRLGLAQARTQAAIKKNAAEVQPNESVEESTYARSKFSSQKSISSDQYFQRGGYDPNLSSEAQTRLSQFQGQSSISSNQYFGREEDEEDDYAPSGHDDFSDLEASARAYYRRFMENPDVQQGIEAFRAGALKVRSFADSSLNISKTSAATARSQDSSFCINST